MSFFDNPIEMLARQEALQQRKQDQELYARFSTMSPRGDLSGGSTMAPLPQFQTVQPALPQMPLPVAMTQQPAAAPVQQNYHPTSTGIGATTGLYTMVGESGQQGYSITSTGEHVPVTYTGGGSVSNANGGVSNGGPVGSQNTYPQSRGY